MKHIVLKHVLRSILVGGLCLAFFLVEALFAAQHVEAEGDLQFEDVIRMLEYSEKQFSYLGTKFVIDYTPDRRSTSLVKVTHGSGLRKKEVTSSTPGESSQVILDDGKFLWHYIPSQASVVKKTQRATLGRISQRIAGQGQLIQQNYDIHIERVPQTPTDVNDSQIPSVIGDVMIAFQPKAQDRPSWKIWLENEHGLIVRTEIYTIEGNLALLSAFSDLTFQPKLSKKSFVMKVPKGTTVQTSVEKHFRSVEEAQQETSFHISVPGYISPGFELSSVIQSPSELGEKVQLAYIDGMSSISIFEEKRGSSPESSPGAGKEVDINQSIKGTFHDHGLLKILRWRLGQDFYFTLVGEVADAELLKIATSLTE